MTNNKYSRNELEAMTSKQIAKYIEDITQTEICRDKNYCKMVCSIYRSKPLTGYN